MGSIKSIKINEEIAIPLSKTKIILLAIGALIFVIVGIWFLYDLSKFAGSSYRQRSSEFIQIIGIVAVIFFGICAIFAFRKLFDKKQGLVINDKGITDNSSAVSAGLIKWSDIIAIDAVKVHSQKFIMIEVSNPVEYIDRKKNRISKMAMRANYNRYGSPISISANSLKTDFNELKSLIDQQYENHTESKTLHIKE